MLAMGGHGRGSPSSSSRARKRAAKSKSGGKVAPPSVTPCLEEIESCVDVEPKGKFASINGSLEKLRKEKGMVGDGGLPLKNSILDCVLFEEVQKEAHGNIVVEKPCSLEEKEFSGDFPAVNVVVNAGTVAADGGYGIPNGSMVPNGSLVAELPLLETNGLDNDLVRECLTKGMQNAHVGLSVCQKNIDHLNVELPTVHFLEEGGISLAKNKSVCAVEKVEPNLNGLEMPSVRIDKMSGEALCGGVSRGTKFGCGDPLDLGDSLSKIGGDELLGQSLGSKLTIKKSTSLDKVVNSLPINLVKGYQGREKSVLKPQARVPFRDSASSSGITWTSLFGSASIDTDLDYFEPKVENGRKVIEPPKEVGLEGASLWSNSLIGQFIEGRVDFNFLCSQVNRLWGKWESPIISRVGKNLFVFRFSDPTAMRNVLENAPWSIGGKPLALRPWTPNMDVQNFSESKIPIWVKFFNVPFEFWTAKGLSYVASSIGKPLYLDQVTRTRCRLDFARICVEVDTKDVLPEEVYLRVGNVEHCIIVEYPWKPKKCASCNLFGHSSNACPKVVKKVWVVKKAKIDAKDSEVVTSSGKEASLETSRTSSDSWEVVRGSGKASPSTAPSRPLGINKPEAILDSNKFEALSRSEDDSIDDTLLDENMPPDQLLIPLKNEVPIVDMLDQSLLGLGPTGSPSPQVVLCQQ